MSLLINCELRHSCEVACPSCQAGELRRAEVSISIKIQKSTTEVF